MSGERWEITYDEFGVAVACKCRLCGATVAPHETEEHERVCKPKPKTTKQTTTKITINGVEFLKISDDYSFTFKCAICGEEVTNPEKHAIKHKKERRNALLKSINDWQHYVRPVRTFRKTAKTNPDEYFSPSTGVVVIINHDRKTGKPVPTVKYVEVLDNLPNAREIYNKHGRGYIVYTKTGVYLLDTKSDVVAIDAPFKYWDIAGGSYPVWRKISKPASLPKTL